MLEEMENTLTDMIESGSSAPDLFTFNSITGGLWEQWAARQDGKIKVLEFMEERLFSPSIVTRNLIIETFGKADDIETMEENLSKTKHLGIKTNTITYCSLVSVYSKTGHIMKVDSIPRQVENSDIVLDTPLFNCVIRAYG
uniref:Pentatricopeptide repeat-containing protein n=2 Tax=Populus TaxID=3689 RepID=A0A4V6XVL0_POPAL|nr:hypothetical protein D5086_0000327000 [Populus alba]